MADGTRRISATNAVGTEDFERTPQNNSDELLLHFLQELGLSHQEAVVYSTLVSLGPSPARDLSRASGLAREHCYEVLRKLEVKSLVKVELSDCSVYAPVEPRAAVHLFISSLDSRFTALREAAYETGALLEALGSRVLQPRQDHTHSAPQIQLVFGKRVSLEFERQLEGCKEEYMGVISPRTLGMPRGLRTLKSLETAAKRGVKVRVLTWVPSEGGDRSERLERFSKNFKIRKNTMAENGLRFGLFDRCRVMQPMHGPAVLDEDRQIILTRNRTVVDSLVIYFEHLWQDSTPLSEL